MAELNQLVIESEDRNAQILSDTITCVHNGRTPLVMTKYKEHARLLYQRLQGSADHVFLLQGGKSSKERAQVRNALLAVSETDTLIVVAIGKYIGEGFNLPRLDTLLLAMPISWQGNVEQYAGCLNRDYDGKQDVIIFDYIDAHVPTLERMYHKRLRAYRQIGFEICANLQAAQEEKTGTIFDAQTYTPVYERDLQAAQREILISSPALSRKRSHIFWNSCANVRKQVSRSKFSRLHPTHRIHIRPLRKSASCASLASKSSHPKPAVSTSRS